MPKTKQKGMEPFTDFQIILRPYVFELKREGMIRLYRALIAAGSLDALPDLTVFGRRFDLISDKDPDRLIYGKHAGDDSEFRIGFLDHGGWKPEEELDIMLHEDETGTSEFFGPKGEFPWRK